MVKHSERPGVQAVLLAFATGLAQVLMAVMAILVARSVQPSELGAATVAIAVCTVVVGVVDFGSNALWIRDLAFDERRAPEMSDRLLTKLATIAVATVLFFVAVLVSPALLPWWTTALFIPALLLEQTLQTPLRARARVPLVACSMLINRVAALGAVLLLGHLGMGAMRLVLALAVGSLVGAVILWLGGARRDFSLAGFTPRNPWRGARHYGILSLSGSLQSLDSVILGAAGGLAAAGIYGAVNRWTQPMGLLIGAFSTASIPHMARTGTVRGGWAAVKRSSIILVGALAVIIGVIIFAEQAVLLLLGSTYSDSAPVLRLLALAMALVVFNQPAAALLQSTGYDRSVSIALSIGVLAQLVAIWVLAVQWGALGAAIAAVVAQIIMAILLASSLRRVLRSERPSGPSEQPTA